MKTPAATAMTAPKAAGISDDVFKVDTDEAPCVTFLADLAFLADGGGVAGVGGIASVGEDVVGD